MLDYGKENQRLLRSLDRKEAAAYHRENQFAAGSMGPKVEVALRFVEGTGNRALITSLAAITEGIASAAGTQFRKMGSDFNFS
jgi:carbamate kinase